jgi:hypothetical protein
MREIMVIAAAVIGAAVGFYVIVAAGAHQARSLTTRNLTGNTSATLWMIAGAVVLPWLTNRWGRTL